MTKGSGELKVSNCFLYSRTNSMCILMAQHGTSNLETQTSGAICCDMMLNGKIKE
jgi:hypothetical protein